MLKQKPDLIRKRVAITKRSSQQVAVGAETLLNFSSNDYLCLATHPDVIAAFVQGAQEFGVGSGASALVSGYYTPHQQLEEKFAEFLQRDKAVLFGNGYLANLGVMSVLGDRHATVLADKLSHASLLDGIMLSRATCVRYRHNDMAHLANLSAEISGKLFFVTEAVFSMEGDITPLPDMVRVAKARKAFLIVDDAHAMGVLGENGKGICEHYRLTQEEVPCLITPLGKAFGGMGALVSGSAEMVESFIQFSRTYRYTTALPPAMANAALAALGVIEKENWRREKLRALIQFFNVEAKRRSLRLLSDDITPIRSIVVGDNVLVMQIKETLQAQGFFVSSIRPPTVPDGAARLRISLNCEHTEKSIERLLDGIALCYE